ncbi:non-hydrolyzing UDP-N-acetylglucosamine 2-epimerase [Curvivirga sp.]|uniref:non-hydrolyzing UDP-N-acetylglucosamine 2-epimerase n=1 Tax=Curvivirga sp. TaxID=2856848 RepID=UPI003B5B984E
MKIHLIVGTRPNFMKVAPIFNELKNEAWCELELIHTGQHYDENMSKKFLQQLGLPTPDYQLNVGGGSHAEQTASIMTGYEKICGKSRPDLVVVVGDVNSTMACSVVAKKLDIQVAHVEAGLRSGDRTMPEEINRLITDSISDIFLTPSSDADENLLNEGHNREKIHLVGNVMIDCLEMLREKIEATDLYEFLPSGLEDKKYIVSTFHRPANVDAKQGLDSIISTLTDLSDEFNIVIPLHPRTKNNLIRFNLLSVLEENTNIHILEPLGYLQFMKLVFGASLIITDSGGIQEEASYLCIPCLTVRPNTERPVTIHEGTNKLTTLENVIQDMRVVLASKGYDSCKIRYWDGHASRRIKETIMKLYGISVH